MALVFRCDRFDGNPLPSDEVAEIRWANREELPELLDPAYACRLIDAFELGAPLVREHDGVNLIRPEGS